MRLGLSVVLYFAICWASSWTKRSAAGLPLFHAQIMITAFYLTVNAIFGFSQIITEEKEDGTLGLLRLTDISALSIIIGKMSGRLADAALLLVLQFPFTIVAITLGGVSWAQVHAAYVALAAYLWLLACVGVLTSVWQPTGARAARMMAILAAIYLVPPYFIMALPAAWRILLAEYRNVSLIMRLSEVTESNFNESPWCWPLVFGMSTGLACLIWAWIVFDRATVGPGQVVRLHPRQIKQRATRRVWSSPILWREFNFLTGGFRWFALRVGIHLLFLFAMPLFFTDMIFRMFAWAAVCGGMYGLIDGTWSASLLFRDEIYNRTWSSLVQTPHSIPTLAFDKTRGWALGMLPSIVIPYAYIIATAITFPHADLVGNAELLMGALTIEIAIFAYLHLLVLMTLYVGWKATPLTLTISFAAGCLYVFTTYSVRISRVDISFLFLGTIWFLVLIMVGLQCLIIRRLKTLAAIA